MYPIQGGWIKSDLEGDQHAFDVGLSDEGYEKNCPEGYKALCGLVATRLSPFSLGAELRDYFNRPKCEVCETRALLRLDDESRARHEADVKKYLGESWWPTP